MMEVDPGSSPPLEENIVDNNSNSRPGSNEQVSEGNNLDDFSDTWLDFKCVFCNQDLKHINRPKLLQCLHTACESCLAAESNTESSGASSSAPGAKHCACPICSQEVNLNEVVDHLFLVEYVQNSENLPEESIFPCTSCEEGAEGAGFCQQCQEWLCDNCINAHHRVRVTKDHTIRPKEEMEGENLAGRNQKYLFCETHSHEQLKLYCESCDKLTCRDCQLSNHKDHKYQFLTKACEEEKGYISELLTKIKEKQTLIENASNNLNKRNEEIAERERALNQEIKTFAVKFITDINKRGKILLQELHKVCDEKKNQLSLKNQELSSISERLKHCQKFAEAAITLGSETALVYSKKPIMTQLRRILKHRCEVPNPNDVVDIGFNYETNFLSGYISSLGQIRVDQQPLPGQVASQNAMLPLPRAVSKSPVMNNPVPPPQPVRQQPQLQQMSQPRMVPQMNMQQMSQAMVPYGQPQVTSSTDMAHSQQMRHKQPMVYANRGHIQRNNVQPSPQANYRMQNSVAYPNNQMMPQQQQQHPQQAQMRQHAQIQQQRQQVQQAPAQTQPPPQPQQQIQQSYSTTPTLPGPLRQNKSLSVTALPSPAGPSPSKQRAIAPRNLSMSVINTPSPTSQRTPSSQQQQRPQVIVLDDQPNQKTPTMSNTNRLSHFPNIAATLASHPGLQIQPTFNNSIQSSPTRLLIPLTSLPQNNVVSIQPSTYTFQPALGSNNNALQQSAIVGTSPSTLYPSSLITTLIQSAVLATPTVSVVPRMTSNVIQSPILPRTEAPPPYPGAPPNVLRSLLVTQSPLLAMTSQSPVPIVSMPSQPNMLQSMPQIQSVTSGASLNTLGLPIDDTATDSTRRNDTPSSTSSESLPSLESLFRTVGGTAIGCSKVAEEEEDPIAGDATDTLVADPDTGIDDPPKDLSENFKTQCTTDLNDDYCAVCKDGGELVCCSFCPKVYHTGCHVPPLSVEHKRNEDWRCRLCTDVLNEPVVNEGKRKSSCDLCGRDLILCERVLLEVLCHPNSEPFYSRVDKKVANYYKIIKKPMELCTMRIKISPSHFEHYKSVEEFLDDMLLMLRNCYTFNAKDSSLHITGKQIELFFRTLTEKFLPEYTSYLPEELNPETTASE